MSHTEMVVQFSGVWFMCALFTGLYYLSRRMRLWYRKHRGYLSATKYRWYRGDVRRRCWQAQGLVLGIIAFLFSVVWFSNS
jgi:hypothetical protein